MKRLSSFGSAQDGEPVEPYLANKDETCAIPVLRFTLHEIRATKSGSAIAEEALMNDEGESTAVEMERLWYWRRFRLDLADSQVSFRDIERYTILDRGVFLN